MYRYLVEVASIDPDNNDSEQFSSSITYTLRLGHLKSVKNIVYDTELNKSKIMLKPFDVISIRPDPFFSIQKTVIVNGAVLFPGEYVILNSEETVYDLVKRVGGLRKGGYAESAKFIRNGKEIKINLKRILKSRRSKHNIRLRDGDKLIVPVFSNVIEVLGEVNAPGAYKYIKGTKIRDVINNAGGFTRDAEKDNVFIVYPNGKSKKYKRWTGNHKITDGSIVSIGRKAEEEPFNRTEYFKELTSIAANLAQALSIMLIARSG